jgi:hypothetical protein
MNTTVLYAGPCNDKMLPPLIAVIVLSGSLGYVWLPGPGHNQAHLNQRLNVWFRGPAHQPVSNERTVWPNLNAENLLRK